MDAPIKILLLEDSPQDAELAERNLRRAGLEVVIKRVMSEEAFRAAVVSGQYELILADFHLPDFDGMSALSIARTLAPEIPFIFVSGSIGEERAIAALREGASDYILKDRPSRLPSAVTSALAQRRDRETRARMQAALIESERRFHYAALATRDVIWDWSIDRDRMWVNDALRSEWGYDVEQLRLDYQSWAGHIHPEDAERVTQSLTEAIGSGVEHWTCEYRFCRPDHSIGFVFDRRLIVRDRDGRAVRVTGAMEDVTSRTLSELRAADAERLARVGNFSRDQITGKHEWSGGMRRLFGFSPEETITDDKAFSRVHPEDRDRWSSGLSPTESVSQFEYRTFDGEGRVRHLQARVRYESLESGALARVFGTVQDVTDRVEAEATRSRLERQLEQASRVSSLGRIAATLAHEFNNVLMGIQPFADVIRKRASDENVQTAATHILGSVGRGRRLTQDILRTTQLAESELAPVDIVALIGELQDELAAVVAPKVALRVHLPEGRLVAMCDAAQMQQVVTNLAANARDAMPAGGELLVSVESIPCADKLMAGITVSDTGTGIPAGILSSIFDPLFTTKRTGTGLGLAVVQQLVSRNHGSISVASVVGKGTTFAILLEAAVDGRRVAGAAPSARSLD